MSKTLVVCADTYDNSQSFEIEDKDAEICFRKILGQYGIIETLLDVLYAETDDTDSFDNEKELEKVMSELKDTGKYEIGEEYEFLYKEKAGPFETTVFSIKYWAEDVLERYTFSFIELPDALK